MERWGELTFKILNTISNSLKPDYVFLSLLIITSGVLFSNSILDVNADSSPICVEKIWMESTHGRIACVTLSTASALVERGWGTILEDSANMQILASMFEVHPEKMRTAAPLPETSIGPQIDYSKGYLVEEIKDGL